MYVFNIIIQSFITLLSPIALGVLLGWIITENFSVDKWIYVILIIFGVITGLIGMVRFILSSMAGIERLEKEQAAADRDRKRRLRKEDGEDGK